MFRIRLALRRAIPSVQVAAVWLLVLAVAGPTNSATILINNGLDCSNPANVVEDDTYLGDEDSVHVRNVGCPPGWPAGNPDDLCPSPGVATEVCVEEGGELNELHAYDSSIITTTGGWVRDLFAYDAATVRMNGGSMDVYAYDSATITVNETSWGVSAHGSSTVLVRADLCCGVRAHDIATITVSDGGAVRGLLDAHDSAKVSISGGKVYAVQMGDTSTFTLSSGSAGYLESWGYASSTITGGRLHNLYPGGASTVTISEGEVGELRAYSGSITTMTGGSVAHIFAYDASTTTVTGGSIEVNVETRGSSTVEIIGGMVHQHAGFTSLRAKDSSIITIVGSNFQVDGAPVPYGDLLPLTGRHLTGVLALGGHIDRDFFQGGGNYTGTITLVPPLTIDIRPRSDANPVNPMSRGIIPVAILGSNELDVSDADVTTLAFGPDGAAPVHRKGGHLRDVNEDGFTDLVSHYRTQETGVAIGDTEACVTGETLDGVPLGGCDFINTQPNCGNGYAAALVVPPVVWVGGRMRRRRR